MRVSLYRANLYAACAYALVSLFVCSTYKLWHPHAVCHLAPVGSVFVTVIWALHCWQLGVANRLGTVRALRNALAPFALAIIAGIACWIHYGQEYSKPIRWIQGTAA